MAISAFAPTSTSTTTHCLRPSSPITAKPRPRNGSAASKPISRRNHRAATARSPAISPPANAPNKGNAMKLIEWLVGEDAQHMYADLNYEYPVRPGVAVNSTIAGYGKLNADTIPLSKIADHKKAAANLVDKVGFDN